jgi:glycosyltransferase involved in cell wall biosynthesis
MDAEQVLPRLRRKQRHRQIKESGRADAPETVIIIPAYNEEGWIGDTLDKVDACLKRIKRKARIIVVDDGSEDNTAEVAKEKGVQVVSLKENMGKAAAIFTGFKHALQLEPGSTILLDADILKMNDRLLEDMINQTQKATRERRTLMVVASWLEEGNSFPTWDFSGIRGFSLPAVYAARASDYKGQVIGFGIEDFFNRTFKDNRVTIGGWDASIAFLGRAQLERLGVGEIQGNDINQTQEGLERKGLKL